MVVKRALRALQSPAYAAALKKNPLLPTITEQNPVTEIFKLLPLSLLALRVSKADPHEGHNHAPTPAKKPQKRTKGLWHVKIEQQQDISEDLHYVWLYEGPQWRQKLYAGGALAAIMAVVMFPLWPIKLRIGVWYLSMAMLGLLGLFFAMAIFRLLLFCITVFTIKPGLWLYPNLFEDVGFFDSFRPVWGWQEVRRQLAAPIFSFFCAPQSSFYSIAAFFFFVNSELTALSQTGKKKSKKASSSKPSSSSKSSASNPGAATATSATNSLPPAISSTSFKTNGNTPRKRDLTPRVEEVEED